MADAPQQTRRRAQQEARVPLPQYRVQKWRSLPRAQLVGRARTLRLHGRHQQRTLLQAAQCLRPPWMQLTDFVDLPMMKQCHLSINASCLQQASANSREGIACFICGSWAALAVAMNRLSLNHRIRLR